jgi:hypothetical protein
MRTVVVNSTGMKERGIKAHLQKTAQRGHSSFVVLTEFY